MKGFIFRLENYPDDVLGKAEILIEASSEEEAFSLIGPALNEDLAYLRNEPWIRENVRVREINGKRCVRPFSGRTYVNQGSNY